MLSTSMAQPTARIKALGISTRDNERLGVPRMPSAEPIANATTLAVTSQIVSINVSDANRSFSRPGSLSRANSRMTCPPLKAIMAIRRIPVGSNNDPVVRYQTPKQAINVVEDIQQAIRVLLSGDIRIEPA